MVKVLQARPNGERGLLEVDVDVSGEARYGAASTAGVLDFDDPSNATHGSGSTLLRGITAINPPVPGSLAFHHPFSFEYTTSDGSGNLTQLAIPYSDQLSVDSGVWMRGRFGGVWGTWRKLGPQPSLVVSNAVSYDGEVVGGYTIGTTEFDAGGVDFLAVAPDPTDFPRRYVMPVINHLTSGDAEFVTARNTVGTQVWKQRL